MKRVVRLTESELDAIIKKVISEAPVSPLVKPGTPPPAPAAPTFSMNRPNVNMPNIPEKKTAPPPKTIFGIGDKDPKVLQFQKNLVALGYNVGKKGADGIFGPATETAVKDFQQKYGIKVSGRVGPPTMRKLIEVVKAKQETKPYDPNAEWNKDRAYSNIPQSPVQQPTQTTTTPQTPQQRSTKSGGSGVLTQKLRNIEPRGYEAPKTPLKDFNKWVAKNRLY